MDVMKQVTKSTKAGKEGSFIQCPKCNGIMGIGHFDFSALICLHCKKEIEKTEFKYCQDKF